LTVAFLATVFLTDFFAVFTDFVATFLFTATF